MGRSRRFQASILDYRVVGAGGQVGKIPAPHVLIVLSNIILCSGIIVEIAGFASFIVALVFV